MLWRTLRQGDQGLDLGPDQDPAHMAVVEPGQHPRRTAVVEPDQHHVAVDLALGPPGHRAVVEPVRRRASMVVEPVPRRASRVVEPVPRRASRVVEPVLRRASMVVEPVPRRASRVVEPVRHPASTVDPDLHPDRAVALGQRRANTADRACSRQDRTPLDRRPLSCAATFMGQVDPVRCRVEPIVASMATSGVRERPHPTSVGTFADQVGLMPASAAAFTGQAHRLGTSERTSAVWVRRPLGRGAVLAETSA